MRDSSQRLSLSFFVKVAFCQGYPRISKGFHVYPFVPRKENKLIITPQKIECEILLRKRNSTMSKRKLHFISIRTKYQLQNATGLAIDHRANEAAILAAVQSATPNKNTIVYDDYFLIEVLPKEEEGLLENAIATSLKMSNLALVKLQTLFCEIDGTPITDRKRYMELAEKEDRIAKKKYIADFGETAYYDGEDEFENWKHNKNT